MNDGFDALMISTATVYAKGTGSPDAYGQENQTFTQVEANVPCRLSTGAGSREYRNGKQAGVSMLKVFMRPRGYALTIHHWLQIGGSKYNIKGIDDPSNLHHHLEVEVELVTG